MLEEDVYRTPYIMHAYIIRQPPRVHLLFRNNNNIFLSSPGSSLSRPSRHPLFPSSFLSLSLSLSFFLSFFSFSSFFQIISSSSFYIIIVLLSSSLSNFAQCATDAVAFNRQDPAATNCLGDVFALAAELTEDPVTSASYLERALREGYDATLSIDVHHADGLVGRAEVALQLARLARKSSSSSSSSSSSHTVTAAVATLERALSRPEKLGGFVSRCEVRYNLACARVLGGDLEGGWEELERLLRVGGATVEEAGRDADLAMLWDRLRSYR